MNNLPLYISIIALILAFVLSLPRMYYAFLAFALSQALKNRKQFAYRLESISLDREAALSEIEVCEMMEQLTGIQSDYKADAADVLAECDKQIAYYKLQEEQNEHAIAALDGFLKLNK